MPNLALCYEKLNNLSAFKEAALRCIEVDPSFIKGYYRLAKAHSLLWDYEQQVNVIERGLEIDSSNVDLQKMLQTATQNRDNMARYEHTTLTPYSVRCYFGGGTVNNIPTDTVYAALDRQSIPPLGKKKYAKLLQYEEISRPVIESFCNGELEIKWHCPTNDSVIIVDGHLPNDTVPVIRYQGKDTPQGFATGFQTVQHKTYHTVFSSKEKQQLCIIMMLRFLGAAGSRLDLQNDIMSSLVDGLIKMCREHKLYNDIVYAKLCLADIAFNKGFDKTILKVVNVGEALESAKRYGEAGEIYCEVTNPEKYVQIPAAPAQALHGFAGLAFKRAQDYVRAEEEYVTALRTSGEDWDRHIQLGSYGLSFSNDSGQTDGTLANMMIFYEIVHRAVTSGLKDDNEHMRMQRACHLLVGLLSVAGYRHPGNTMFEDPQIVQMCQDAIKSEHKSSAEIAMRAVVHATMAPTIDDYHQRLLDCMDGDEYLFMTMYSPEEKAEMRADLLEDQKRKSKESARDVIDDMVQVDSTRIR